MSTSIWVPGCRYTASAILLIDAVAITGVDAFLRGKIIQFPASLALRACSHPDHWARHRLGEQLPLQQCPFRRTPLVTDLYPL